MVKQPNGQAAQKLKPVPRSNAIAGMVLAGAVFLGSIAALITGLVWYSKPDAALQQIPEAARRLAETERSRRLIERMEKKGDAAVGAASGAGPAAPAD